jgi:hypothetical protein
MAQGGAVELGGTLRLTRHQGRLRVMLKAQGFSGEVFRLTV